MARYGSTGSLSRMQQMINKVNKGMNNPTANLKTAGGPPPPPPPPPDNKQNKPPQGTYSGSKHSYRNIQAAIDEYNKYQHEYATVEGGLRRNFRDRQKSENISGGNIIYPKYSDEAKPVITASGKPRIIKDLKQSDKQEKSTMFIGEDDESGRSSILYHDLQNNPAITFHKNYRQYMSGGESFYLPQAGLSDAPELPQLWNVSKSTESVPELKPLTAAKRKKRVSSNQNKARYMKQKKLASKYKKQQFVYEDRGDWRDAKRAKRKGEEDAITSGRYAKHEDKVTYYKGGQVDTKLQGYDQARAEEIYQGRLEHDAKKMEEYKNQYVKWDTARVGLGLQSQPYEDFIAKQKLKTP
jgi:hypothetical protein